MLGTVTAIKEIVESNLPGCKGWVGERSLVATYVAHGTSVGRWLRGRTRRRGGCGALGRGPQIESSTRDRARICKYRHIYKRKGSPERRTNAALRGNQSGEIPTASDRKMSNQLRVHHSTRCGARRGRRSTAALLSPLRFWYIYRLIIEVVCVTIIRSSLARQAGGGRQARSGAIASAPAHCVTASPSALPRPRSLRILSQPHDC